MHRGSSSEGIDFSNDNARMVICVGIPFANFSDDTIKKKIEYLDGKDENKGLFYSLGNKWHEADAMINVNQSLGRVIRNKNDYGVMICIDERFCLNSINNLFSDWLLINKEIKSINENNNYFNELDQFYSYCQDKYLNKRTMNIMNNEKNVEKQNNLLEFNEIINNKNIDVNDEINESGNILLKKRKRKVDNESNPFSISNNYINEEEEEEEILIIQILIKIYLKPYIKIKLSIMNNFKYYKIIKMLFIKKRLSNVQYALLKIIKVFF